MTNRPTLPEGMTPESAKSTIAIHLSFLGCGLRRLGLYDSYSVPQIISILAQNLHETAPEATMHWLEGIMDELKGEDVDRAARDAAFGQALRDAYAKAKSKAH